MPRFNDSRTWNILRDVPATYSRLVMEALSLRQKIVLARQGAHFLKRCLQHNRFIRGKGLHELCGRTEEDRQIKKIELRILKMTIRNKQDHVYSLLNKCSSKEMYCERFLPAALWKRIVGLRQLEIDEVEKLEGVGEEDHEFQPEEDCAGVTTPLTSEGTITFSGGQIVPEEKGAGVVTTRGHVRYVVTEYGVADLGGKSVRQRAYHLIQLAHPDDREHLESQAFERFKCAPSSS